jgi:Zn-finger nucleic acid-binding protein
VRLVACPSCHAQYDVTDHSGSTLVCRCGETIDASPRPAVDAEIRRCGSCGAVVAAGTKSCDYCGSEVVRDPGDLSLICPECYARNAQASRFCTACGVAFRPQSPAGRDAEVPCPDCGAPMPARTVGDVGVNECPECHGLWVPDDRFDALVSRAIEMHRDPTGPNVPTDPPRMTSGNPVAAGVKYRKCPVCEAFMLRRNYRRTSGVIVDSCRDHGTWLDADELEQIAGFIRSGGLQRAERARETTMRAGSTGAAGSARAGRASTEFTKILMDRNVHSGQRRLLESFVDYLNELFSK